MITKLRLTNFRRHENTVINLGPEDATVVVSGLNGAGKSTIIESIVYALVGEGRHGARSLDRLVRRGAEIEGMEVELEFSIDNTSYRILRRREGKNASAVLCVNGQATVEGSRHVTNAVEDILGMDSQGIRLAVVAYQKELDLLVSLSGAARSKAIGRLLRLDAIAKARDDARNAWRVASQTLDSLPDTGDLVVLAGQVADFERRVSQASSAEQECRSEITVIDAELAVSMGIDSEYAAAREAIANAEGSIGALRSELSRIEGELGAVVVPDAVTGVVSVAVLERQASELEHSIARAEAARRVSEQRRVLEAECVSGEARLKQIEEALREAGAVSWLEQAEDTDEQAAACRTQSNEASAQREALREELGSVRHECDRISKRIELIESLGDECETCGQSITTSHKHAASDDLVKELSVANARREDITTRGVEARDRYEALEKQIRELEDQSRSLRQKANEAARLEGEARETQRRCDTFRAQLSRLETDDVKVDELYEKKGVLALAVMESREAAAKNQERLHALERVRELTVALDSAKTRVREAEIRLTGVQLTEELTNGYQRRQELAERHRAEMLMLTSLCSETSTAKEQLTVVTAALRHANEIAASRRGQQEKGRDNANASRLLADVETTIGGAIRPSLESVVSDILCQMSTGRFTNVKVGADYDVTVLDQGAYRPLSELSGGEADLVALAVRLGLADVVCQRSGEIGFLILDEPFGSQDSGRRESILQALRALRSRYGQVWCISHVGGLDEVADRVINVECDENEIAVVS